MYQGLKLVFWSGHRSYPIVKRAYYPFSPMFKKSSRFLRFLIEFPSILAAQVVDCFIPKIVGIYKCLNNDQKNASIYGMKRLHLRVVSQHYDKRHGLGPQRRSLQSTHSKDATSA